MVSLLLWYLCLTLLGLLVFPLAYHLLPGLADRGYTLSRTLGLLLWGYLFWLLSSTGWVYNDRGGILLAAFLVVAASLLALRQGNRKEFRSWLADHRTLILSTEILFLAAFCLMAFIRAANPEITATEKPMELAFINAIRRSPTFPPHDPWLAGYAISYYYFGYILVGMLAQLLGTSSGVAFNLGISLVFALSAVGAFGLVNNLLVRLKPAVGQFNAALRSLLGPVFVLVLGNLVGLLEILHARGFLWRQSADGSWSSAFWSWLDLKDLNLPPNLPLQWLPTRFLWWWRSSRVLQDFDLRGGPIEIIDEFPFFSYLLADLHPHVLAMPFAFLAMGLALNVFSGGFGNGIRIRKFNLPFTPAQWVVIVIALGGMAFLNIWDFPIYTALFAGAYVLYQAAKTGWSRRRLGEFFGLGLLLGVGGLLAYLPWFVGFQSQAGGIYPNLIFPTRGIHFWLMFATLLLPLLAYLIYLHRNWPRKPDYRFGLIAAFGLLLVLLAVALLFGAMITLLPELGSLYLGLLKASSLGEALISAFTLRVRQPGTWLSLGLLLAVCLAFLKRTGSQLDLTHAELEPEAAIENAPTNFQAHTFALLLIVVGALLVIAPEFVFLRDLFNNRMNTIFKFYYQAWLLWGVAAAFGSAVLLESLRGAWAWIYRLGLAAVLLVGLVYPVLSLNTKTNGFRPADGYTLDGNAYLQRQAPDEVAAFAWLWNQPLGNLAEAVGGSYSGFARVATHSGMPTVLGWPFHEVQWRGSAAEQGSREADLQRLYCTQDWNEAESIITQYGIKYVYVGALEINRFQPDDSCRSGLDERKFQLNMELAFSNPNVRIYRMP